MTGLLATAGRSSAQQRMKGMHDLIELMTTWFDDIQRRDQPTLVQLMKMGAKVQRLLEFAGKAKPAARRPQ
jgi:DNA-binding transcriptional regulator GbsR (MarR family)